MLLDNRPLQWILNPRNRWLQHVLFWALMYMPHWLSYMGLTSAHPQWSELPVYLVVFCLDAFVVYFNLYYLVPKFFVKEKFWLYGAFSVATVSFNSLFGATILEFVLSGNKVFQPDSYAFVESFQATFTILMTAVGLNISKRFLVSQARLKELETTGLKAELAYLKHQINPHFLFNSLNNIYVQSKKTPADASESILQLSDLLRYQLYDCAKDKVDLGDEIRYLETFLELDKMRKNKSQVDFRVTGDSPNGIAVAPFLFIPFVENALKHGINMNNETKIKVHFNVRPEQVLFEIENSKPDEPLAQTIKGGIGLANISRRLDLLYPGKYRLDIDNELNVYRVRLAVTP